MRRRGLLRQIILARSSAVFESMFTSPQGPGSVEDEQLNVIPVAEDKEALYQILSWCDLRCKRSWDLKDIQLALRGAEKYGMKDVIAHIKQVLTLGRGIVEAEPVKLYAIAIRYGFEELAHTAAWETLRLTLEEWPDVPELADIPAIALQRFQK